MRNSEYSANKELSDTPRRRRTPDWVPPKSYIGLVDVVFVGAGFLAAVWFLGEFGGEVWELLKSGLAMVTSGGR